MTRTLTLRVFLVAIVLYSIVAFAFPQRSLAFGFAADASCNGSAQCPVGHGPNQNGPCSGPGGGTIGRACSDPGSNVTGMCISSIPGKCEASNAPGLGGKGNSLDQGLSQLGQVLGQLMSKLMSGGGSGSGSGSGSGGTPGVNTTPTCTAQPTSDMATYQSNPQCYYYVPPVSASLGANTTSNTTTGTSISDLLNAGFPTVTNSSANPNPNTNPNPNPNPNSNPNINSNSTSNTNPNTNSSSNSNTNSNTNSNSNTNISDLLAQATSSPIDLTTIVTIAATPTPTPAPALGPIVSVPTNAANLLPGIRGDIQVFSNGATILGGQRDTSSNSETSGFFGANTLSGVQPTGIVASLCQSRPWASGLFSKLLPATFFDGLCSLRGYQVGTPQQVTTPPQVVVSQSQAKPVTKPVVKSTATTTTTTAKITVPPKVDIWAVPAKVSLGSRTSIFWNTQGVSQCTETSPDGSFSQTSLSGGASTVPITEATTFTISCLAPDGSHTTGYVTVELAI